VRDIRNLSKDERVEELIKSNTDKLSYYNTSFPFTSVINNDDLRDFFEKVYQRIWYITDSPSFVYHVKEKSDDIGNTKLIALNYSTVTMKNDTLDGFVDLINNQSLNDKFIVFYLINKVDGVYQFRFSTIEDEGLKKIENRDKKINQILDGKQNL
jgi:hypothetical protein